MDLKNQSNFNQYFDRPVYRKDGITDCDGNIIEYTSWYEICGDNIVIVSLYPEIDSASIETLELSRESSYYNQGVISNVDEFHRAYFKAFKYLNEAHLKISQLNNETLIRSN